MVGHVKKPKVKQSELIAVSPGSVNVATPTVIVESTPDCKSVTISPLKDGKYEILVIEIDSVSKLAGKVTVVDTADTKMEANEKFKLNVVRHGII